MSKYVFPNGRQVYVGITIIVTKSKVFKFSWNLVLIVDQNRAELELMNLKKKIQKHKIFTTKLKITNNMLWLMSLNTNLK